jgi:hypothetical protein
MMQAFKMHHRLPGEQTNENRTQRITPIRPWTPRQRHLSPADHFYRDTPERIQRAPFGKFPRG